MTWPELQRSHEFRGRWVALDNCRYDAKTAQPVEGSVVDATEKDGITSQTQLACSHTIVEHRFGQISPTRF